MLERLSGPTTIYNGNSPGSPITAIGVSVAPSAFYDDSLGLCTYNLALGGYSFVQLDGTAYLHSYQSGGRAFTLDLQRAASSEYLLHYAVFDNALYEFNKVSGTLGELVIDTGVTADMTGIQARAADRYLMAQNQFVRYRPLDLSATWVNEATLTGASFSGQPIFSRTRAANVVALVWASGKIAYYDFVAQEQVGGVSYIGANAGAWYSPKHDIFVAFTSSLGQSFSVYSATEVRPSSLSSPVAVSSIVQGRVSQVKVRLLGADSDPCVDELVDWSITAGSGTLAEAQSTTDEDGYAYNDYIAPVTGGAGSPYGSVTIQAQVLY